MSLVLTSPFSGDPMTGLSGPTYTPTEDENRPNHHSKQWAITALGGTQSGVEAHSISQPFTFTVEVPAVYKLLGQPNPVTGIISSVPRNVFTTRTRKGVLVDSTQRPSVFLIETKYYLPAGADVADPNSVMAAVSCNGGATSDLATEIGAMLLNGVM